LDDIGRGARRPQPAGGPGHLPCVAADDNAGVPVATRYALRRAAATSANRSALPSAAFDLIVTSFQGGRGPPITPVGRIVHRFLTHRAFVLACRTVLAVVLVVAATSKALDPGSAAGEWGEAFQVGRSGGAVLVWFVIALEYAIGTLLVTGLCPRLVGLSALGLFSLFLAVTVIAWLGFLPLVRCRCFGPLELGGRVGLTTFIRNLLLVAMSGTVAAYSTTDGSDKAN